jgi:radical SAM superfamily enzyme YgiQ (UPF0313 family)
VKVLLISANTEIINMPVLPLGLACVAEAARRAGHDVVTIDLMSWPDRNAAIRCAIESFEPEVLGVSVRNIDDQVMEPLNFLLPAARGVVAECRRHTNAPIVVGGAGFSIFPESALEFLGADAGVWGEGEAVFPVLAERLARGEAAAGLPGVVLPGRKPDAPAYTQNLDELPLPAPELFVRPGVRVPVQTRRGCPMNCSYCSTRAIEGGQIRRRSPEAVVAWLKQLREAGARNFAFVDNTFNLPPSYAKQLCRRIVEAGLDLDFWCIVYPRNVDGELARLMRQAGCTEVSLGFESGCDAIMRALNKRFTAEQVRAVSRAFAQEGIAQRGFLLLGGPGETRQTVEESLAFADSLKLEGLSLTAGIRIYPNTILAHRAVEDGIVAVDDNLLYPRFYMRPELRDWLPGRLQSFRAARPWLS